MRCTGKSPVLSGLVRHELLAAEKKKRYKREGGKRRGP